MYWVVKNQLDEIERKFLRINQWSPFKSGNSHIDCFLLDLKGLVT